jgi:uncharacterized damage-inducible protein DinB
MTKVEPEAWLRGPVPGVPTSLQPVAHALVQAVDDAERAVSQLDDVELWTSPGGAASVGYHLVHMAGSIDRLLTYARGETLSADQRDHLERERSPDTAVGAEPLLARLSEVVAVALAQLRSTKDADLDHPRGVGRAALPSSVRGLLHHAGEHAARHAGQIVTTARVVGSRR